MLLRSPVSTFAAFGTHNGEGLHYLCELRNLALLCSDLFILGLQHLPCCPLEWEVALAANSAPIRFQLLSLKLKLGPLSLWPGRLSFHKALIRPAGSGNDGQ